MYLLLGREEIEIGFCGFLTIDPICQALLMPLEEKKNLHRFLFKRFCRILSIGEAPFGFFLWAFFSTRPHSPRPIILGTVPFLKPRKIARDPGAVRALKNEDSIMPGTLLSLAFMCFSVPLPNAQRVFVLTVAKALSRYPSGQVWSKSKDPS